MGKRLLTGNATAAKSEGGTLQAQPEIIHLFMCLYLIFPVIRVIRKQFTIYFLFFSPFLMFYFVLFCFFIVFFTEKRVFHSPLAAPYPHNVQFSIRIHFESIFHYKMWTLLGPSALPFIIHNHGFFFPPNFSVHIFVISEIPLIISNNIQNVNKFICIYEN